MTNKKIIFAFISICFYYAADAQQRQDSKQLDNHISLLFGIGQITQHGFNVEGNLLFKRIAFDYSHGVSLDLANAELEAGMDKNQGLAIHLPWTTGFGIGYRFNEWLNLKAEPKWHKFELYYDGEEQNANTLINDYTTFTVGLGLYANIRPFKNQHNFLKGIMIAPNVRWWPQISSSLDDNKFVYQNNITNQQEVHTARQIGIGNTPFIANLSIGYSFLF